jgi:hypothetical protein
MSELEIPERAYESGEHASSELNPQTASLRLQLDTAIEAAAPIIVAAELRRFADELYELRRSMREADDRGIRSSAIGEVIITLRHRADLLDPDGMAW